MLLSAKSSSKSLGWLLAVYLTVTFGSYVAVIGDYWWDYQLCAGYVMIACLAWACVQLIPNRHLKQRCVVGVIAVGYTLAPFGHLVSVSLPKVAPFFGIISLFFQVVWCFVVLFRPYKLSNDRLTDGHFYLLCRRPDSWSDYLIALFGNAYGGGAIYARGEVFHYYHGELLRKDVRNNPEDKEWFEKRVLHGTYTIVKGGRFSQERLDHIREVYADPTRRKWTLYRNCVTLLYWSAR